MPLRVQSHGAVPKHHRALLGTGPGTQPRAVRGHRGKFTHGHVQGLASPSLTPERHNATKTTEAELQIQEKQERTTQTWGKKASRGRATSPSPAAPPPRASPPLPEHSPGPLTCPPSPAAKPMGSGQAKPPKLPLAAGWAVSRARGAPQAPACTTHPSQRTRPAQGPASAPSKQGQGPAAPVQLLAEHRCQTGTAHEWQEKPPQRMLGVLPRLSPTASQSRRGGSSPAQRDTSCSPGDAEEAPSLLQQPPRSGEWEGKCKKQQKAAKRSPALHG